METTTDECNRIVDAKVSQLTSQIGIEFDKLNRKIDNNHLALKTDISSVKTILGDKIDEVDKKLGDKIDEVMDILRGLQGNN